MNSLENRTLEILHRYMSPILARSILSLSVSWAGVEISKLMAGDVARFMEELTKGIILYVPEGRPQQECLENLSEIFEETDSGEPEEALSRFVAVREENDIVTARSVGREVCIELGFPLTLQVRVATAISELARNIVQYAIRGEIIISGTLEPPCIEIVASDSGPGIADIDAVMSDSYQSTRGMGIGLKGTRNMMDEFSISSVPGEGTVVRIKKCDNVSHSSTFETSMTSST